MSRQAFATTAYCVDPTNTINSRTSLDQGTPVTITAATQAGLVACATIGGYCGVNIHMLFFQYLKC